ncbi:molybdenum ABC transporter ATP-binding protein [Marinobacter litoralis]|uniref:molybdenum ABC transporter ATP-binding protein n=1 Tax=Marinobacter litoralis TaxID=187981 RepID=UPI0018ED2CFA|nr:molybdenum ABC transporter ATP-binding protein [Marinobacter litoralis]MBJ6136662.1 molybdenum ABC transporter ATP-binding protein [Marinobacter litoralis]
MISPDTLQARFQCHFDQFALDVDLNLPGSGITAIFGHSGCGKTTLLRCIAGLQTAQGQLSVLGEAWQTPQESWPVHKRPLAYVFQDTSLFPHLSVRKNLLYGYRRVPAGQRKITPEQVYDWLGLEPLLERMPAGLSGGERQRVAIGRALLTSPRLLLMDEPLSALDHQSKQDILPYLERLRDSLAIPVLYVSHSTSEVARLADHIVMMDRGQVIAQGPLQETLARTDQPFRLEEDAGVVLDGEIAEVDAQWQLSKVVFNGGELWLRHHDHLTMGMSVRVQVLARDVSIALHEHRGQSIQNLLPATVDHIAREVVPGITLVRLLAGDTAFLARLTSRSAHQLQLTPGLRVWLQIKSVALAD